MNERRKKHHSANKRNTVAVVAVLLVCILAIGGTIAYLTSHSELENTFTVGQISPIIPEEGGPNNKPIDPSDKDNGRLSGNLYEPSWVKDSKLLPSATIDKDPYVGVGAGSEECEVYVYVTNTMTNNNHIYFTINNGWEPVSGYATPFDGTKYTGGLFKYQGGLNALEVKGENVWTSKPLFSNVVVSNDAEAGDFNVKDGTGVGSITVQSFLHQKNDANKQPIAEKTILDAVKKQFSLQ